MQIESDIKIKALLWDLPENHRKVVFEKIRNNPVEAFSNDNQLLLKALGSFSWYELTRLLGHENLLSLLTDATIQKLFPVQRRNYYLNARRLLSKYALPTSG